MVSSFLGRTLKYVTTKLVISDLPDYYSELQLKIVVFLFGYLFGKAKGLDCLLR